MVVNEQTLLESGQVIWHHPTAHCFGEWCAIHRPMPGPWASWPRLWREDRGIMERTCPHGVGHPVAEMVGRVRDDELDHACDGCPCGPSEQEPVTFVGIEAATARVAQLQAWTRLDVLKDALDLVADLWPKPGYASVVLETHQWIKLRRVLLAIPDLVDPT